MLIRGDARHLPLPDECIDCIVTSPPYFGLRDYGHAHQIGLEDTPDAYVQSLVEVFREIGRVLSTTGTLWLNLGDSYNSRSQYNHHKPGASVGVGDRYTEGAAAWPGHRSLIDGLKPKDLLGMPWMVAFALRADGWYLRSDVIWHKPNPMPESVTDRPTRAHEYLFLLTKSQKYHCDMNAIREPYVEVSEQRKKGVVSGFRDVPPSGEDHSAKGATRAAFYKNGGSNKRSVWSITAQSYTGAHFATMPEALVEPCILAGCKPGGRVLDPFVGSGTVVAVAQRLGRLGIGVDLSYQDLARERTAQRGLMFGLHD